MSPFAIPRHSSGFVRRYLLGCWLVSSILLSFFLALYDIWEHHRHIVREGEQTAHVVSASLRTRLTNQQRQQLLVAYGHTNRMVRFDRMNWLLVVDGTGRIAYTSRPAWRSLRIIDSTFETITSDDANFRAVVQCLRERATDCMELRSGNWPIRLSGFTLVRPVSQPPMDLGLPRQNFLVLVNFDSGMLVGDFLQDLPILMLWVLLVSSLLLLALWYGTTRGLMPEFLEASNKDSLTQLINRTSFMEQAMDVLAEAEERQTEFIFAILDLDHFKRINDTYGHGCGDAALASVGRLLLTVTRPDDLVCRFGGEEFALLLSMSRSEGSKALERLRLQLEMNCLHYNGYKVPLTASLGAAATKQCGYSIDFLYNSADKALYAAKHAGRNRVEWNAGEITSRLPSSAAISAATGP